MSNEDFYNYNRSSYIRLLTARNLARFTNMAFYVYFMWEIVYVYHSIFLVSLIPGFSFLGYLIVALPEGAIIDKYDRSKIYIIVNAIILASYFMLLKHSLYTIYTVDLISSTMIWIITDDLRAITKEIIPHEKMEHAQSINMFSSGIFELGGIITGGIFIFVGYDNLMLLLIAISIIELILSSTNRSKKLYVKKNNNTGFGGTAKIALTILPFLLLGLLLNGMFVALDVFASGLIHIIMHAPSYYYTFFVAGYPAGILFGGIISMNPKISKIHAKKYSMTVYIFLSGILFILIALNRIAILDGIFTIIIGTFLAFINIVLESKIINGIPNSITGKFNSLTMMFSVSSSPVMAFFFGYISRFVYFPDIILAAGIVVTISAISVRYVMESFDKNIGKVEPDYSETGV